MPPKRKRASDPNDEKPPSAAPNTRATRVSTRNATKEATASDSSSAPISKAKAAPKVTKKTTTKTKALKAVDVEMGSVEPPPKKVDDLNPASFTPTRLIALFDKYADPEDATVISPEGLMTLCEEASMSMEGIQPILLAWVCKAKKMGSITQNEWLEGLVPLKIDTVAKLSLAMSDFAAALYPTSVKKSIVTRDVYDKAMIKRVAQDPGASLKEFYNFVFELARVDQQRNIEMDTATAFWEVVLSPKYPMIMEIIEYIKETGPRFATRDVWKMTYQFLDTVGADLSGYDPEEAWPTLLDGFVEWKRAKV